MKTLPDCGAEDEFPLGLTQVVSLMLNPSDLPLYEAKAVTNAAEELGAN